VPLPKNATLDGHSWPWTRTPAAPTPTSTHLVMNAVASSGGAAPVRRLERDGTRRRLRL